VHHPPHDVKTALLAVVEDWRQGWIDGDKEAALDYATELLAIMTPLIERGDLTAAEAWRIVFAASDDIMGRSPGAAAQALNVL